MDFDYIIVQAGGEGARLYPLTENRPKALVPVNNRPILFHLMDRFPSKKFIIIGDYKFQVFSLYLEHFAKSEYILLHSIERGNVSGLNKALEYIPDNRPFMIIWSDLLLADDFYPDKLKSGCYVGVTDQFPCSWSFKDGILEKNSIAGHGVAGCFLFDKKERLAGIPKGGSFTRFLQKSTLSLEPMNMGQAQEVGTMEAIERLDNMDNRCRPYNRIVFEEDRVVKEGLTPEAKKLLQREVEWYRLVDSFGYGGIPKLYSLEPLTMSRIHGENIFKADIDDQHKMQVLDRLFTRLDELHKLQPGNLNYFDMYEELYGKTMKRLRSIQDVIPFSQEEEITINNVPCKNVLRQATFFQELVESIMTPCEFGVLHGDCTLTNTLIDSQYNIYFIDARGYFGRTPLVGDLYYDWAKVYYSIQGAFDQFNVKRFSLHIDENAISYNISSSGWEHFTQYFLNKIPNCDQRRIKIIHGIIWMSLASHCWEDYDSLCLAFYNGLYLLNTLEE